MDEAAELALRLRGRASGRGWIACCPAHDDRTPSLSIGQGTDGRLLLHCFAGCAREAIWHALQAKTLWTGAHDRLRAGRAKRWRTEAKNGDRAQAARRLWHAARPIAPGDPADRYLSSRELGTPRPPSLRFLPRARHISGALCPALVAAACRWPERQVVAVQLTALTAAGRKAAVKPLRWTMGPLGGAAVRLAPWTQGVPLVLAEGIEDGLTAQRALPHVAAWAVLGAANAAAVRLPPAALPILAFDGDRVGRQAADGAAAALRARGHRVRIARLPDGQDLNDLLLRDAGELAA